MRPFSIVPVALLLGTTPLCVLADDPSKTSLQSATQDVQTAQTQLHQERTNYLHVVQTSGKDSPQALAAKSRLDTAHERWRQKLANRQTVRHQARRDMMQRREAQRPKRTSP